MLLVRVVIFRYVALFWNQSTSEVTGGLNIEVKFRTVSPPVEIRGGQANIGVFFYVKGWAEYRSPPIYIRWPQNKVMLRQWSTLRMYCTQASGQKFIFLRGGALPSVPFSFSFSFAELFSSAFPFSSQFFFTVKTTPSNPAMGSVEL